MHFISRFGFYHHFPGTLSLCIPDHVPVFLFDAFQNMRRARTPAAVWKNRVGEREFRERDFAAAEECGRIRT